MKGNYDVIGNGPKTIVWLHGFLENRRMWQNWVNRFTDYRHLLIDLPGHGCHSSSMEVFTMEWMAEFVRSVIVDSNTLDPILAGHSMGGYVALAYQEMFGDAKAIILIHSTSLPDNPEKQKNRDRVSEIVLKNKLIFTREAIPGLFREPFKYKDLVTNLVLEASEMSANSIVAALQGMKVRLDRTSVLKCIPAHIITGKFDMAIDVELLSSAVSNINGVSRYELAKSAHMGMYEQPEDFERILREILEKCN